MAEVSIRELMHNFSHYLKTVKQGESITILERNKPVAGIVPINKNVTKPGWKRTIKPVKIKGETFSETLARERRESR